MARTNTSTKTRTQMDAVFSPGAGARAVDDYGISRARLQPLTLPDLINARFVVNLTPTINFRVAVMGPRPPIGGAVRLT